MIDTEAAGRSAWLGESASWFAFGTAPTARGLATTERRPGLMCLWWLGDPHRLENNIWLEDPRAAGEPGAALGALGGRLAQSAAATDLRLPVGPCLPAWAAAAARHGFEPAEEDPLMARDLHAPPASAPGGPPAAIRVRAADAPADRALALGVIVSVWGDPDVCRFFAPEGASRLYLAEQGAAPAGAATTMRDGDGVRIFSVSTREDWRRQGVARALLDGIATAEAAAGVRWATLRTVDELVPLYTAAGFEVVGRMARFRRPSGPHDPAP